MKILVIGGIEKAMELKEKLGEENDFTFLNNPLKQLKEVEGLENFDIIFDLDFDSNPASLEFYATLEGMPVIVSAVKQQLIRLVHNYKKEIHCYFIGMNCLKTFINREKTECTLLHEFDQNILSSIESKLNINFTVVADRVGMVTPRIVLMIINEACFVVQEGTASMEDIDLGMKLGTNYPMGPFEWADKIGIDDVFETLAAIYEDTKDERYRISPMLKRHYLSKQPFFKSKA